MLPLHRVDLLLGIDNYHLFKGMVTAESASLKFFAEQCHMKWTIRGREDRESEVTNHAFNLTMSESYQPLYSHEFNEDIEMSE